MPEPGVAFNSDPRLPREYLMRRSYNSNDVQIPGAVVREWGCPECGRVEQKSGWCLKGDHSPLKMPVLEVHGVDVPLLRTDGKRWSEPEIEYREFLDDRWLWLAAIGIGAAYLPAMTGLMVLGWLGSVAAVAMTILFVYLIGKMLTLSSKLAKEERERK